MELRDHCWQIEKFSFSRLCYAIVDVDAYLADDLFINHQVTVRFGPEYMSPDGSYRVIFCSIRKHDEKAFLQAVKELPDKMLLLGHTDYPEYCARLRRPMDNAKEGVRHREADRSPEETKQACAKGVP